MPMQWWSDQTWEQKHRLILVWRLVPDMLFDGHNCVSLCVDKTEISIVVPKKKTASKLS